MAQTNAQRQASYRAKRKAAGDCIEPGCGNPAAPYTRCETHRLNAKQAAAEGRITKAEHQAVLAERDELKRLSGELLAKHRIVVVERNDIERQHDELLAKHLTAVAKRDDFQEQIVALRKEYKHLREDYEMLSEAMTNMLNHVPGG